MWPFKAVKGVRRSWARMVISSSAAPRRACSAASWAMRCDQLGVVEHHPDPVRHRFQKRHILGGKVLPLRRVTWIAPRRTPSTSSGTTTTDRTPRAWRDAAQLVGVLVQLPRAVALPALKDADGLAAIHRGKRSRPSASCRRDMGVSLMPDETSVSTAA